jgi:hypothetical protein
MTITDLIVAAKQNVRGISLETDGSEHYNEDPKLFKVIHYFRQFSYEDEIYYFVFGLRTVDIDEEDGTKYKGHHLEYRFQKNHNTNHYLIAMHSKEESFDGIHTYFPKFDINEFDYRSFLCSEMKYVNFPEWAINYVLDNEKGNGVCSHAINPIVETLHDRIKIVEKPFTTITNSTAIILDEVFSESEDGSRPIAIRSNKRRQRARKMFGLTSNSYSGSKIIPFNRFTEFLENHRGYFYPNDTLTNAEILEWLNHNTTGNIHIYGTKAFWKILFFENKTDAFNFKMFWGDS